MSSRWTRPSARSGSRPTATRRFAPERQFDVDGTLVDLRRELVGRDVLPGRWTFEVVEKFAAGYDEAWRSGERRVREATVEGRAHVLEAELKTDRQGRSRR